MRRTPAIITARMGSERLPGKVLANVGGKPLLHWLIERVRTRGFQPIVATTHLPDDDPIAHLAGDLQVPCFRGHPTNVLERVFFAKEAFARRASYWVLVPGDCPFWEGDLALYALQVARRFGADACIWATEPWVMPVYGARELPRSNFILQTSYLKGRGDELEHPDLYFHRHRSEFAIVYAEVPARFVFRPYRLEVDWPEDVEVVRRIAEGVGMLADLKDVIAFLDTHQDVPALNAHRVEKTGPSRFPYQLRREWMKQMRGRPIVDKEGQVWAPASRGAQPVFCDAGTCLLGFAARGILYTRAATIVAGRLECACGAGKIWHPPKRRSSKRRSSPGGR